MKSSVAWAWGLLTALAWVAAVPASAAPIVIKDLEFNVDGVLPSAESGISFYSSPSASESAFYSVSGGLLHQRTLGTNGNFSYSFPDNSLTGGGLDPLMPTTMEARLQVERIEGFTGAFFQLHDGAYRYLAALNATGLEIPTTTGQALVAVDVFQFHTYRFETAGNGGAFEFFVDDVSRVSNRFAPTLALNGFGWGDGESTAAYWADADWDFVRVSQNPVPEPASLILLGTGLLVAANRRRFTKRA